MLRSVGRSCLLTDVSARSTGPHLRQSSSLHGLLDCQRSELGSPWTDFHETLYCGFLVKSGKKITVLLKSDTLHERYYIQVIALHTGDSPILSDL